MNKYDYYDPDLDLPVSDFFPGLVPGYSYWKKAFIMICFNVFVFILNIFILLFTIFFH